MARTCQVVDYIDVFKPNGLHSPQLVVPLSSRLGPTLRALWSPPPCSPWPSSALLGAWPFAPVQHVKESTVLKVAGWGRSVVFVFRDAETNKSHRIRGVVAGRMHPRTRGQPRQTSRQGLQWLVSTRADKTFPCKCSPGVWPLRRPCRVVSSRPSPWPARPPPARDSCGGRAPPLASLSAPSPRR